MEKNILTSKIGFNRPLTILAAAFLVSLAIYILAFVLPANLLLWYDRVGLELHILPEAGILGYVRLIVAFIILAIVYALAYFAARQVSGKLSWIIVLGGTVLFGIAFLFMAPFDARDIYDNIFHGRILGIYGANPFSDRIVDFPQDPFYDYAWWVKSSSAYGPGWEVLAGITARLAGNGILANTLAFKMLPGFFHLTSLGVAIWVLRRTAPENALPGALLLGWNPVVLYETWGNGHNDIAMVFWILLAALCLTFSRYTLAALSVMAGALVKFFPVILLPAVFMAGYRHLERTWPRLRFILLTTTAIILLTMAAYMPFWAGFSSLNINQRMKMFTTSIPAVLYQLILPTLGVKTSARLISLFAFGILVGFTIYQTLNEEKKEPAYAFLQKAFNIQAFYLMLTCLWFQQWYSLWLIGLAPLLPKFSRRIALVFGFWVISKQLIFGALIVPWIIYLPQAKIWLEPLLTVSVLGVPWLFTLMSYRKAKKTKGSLYAA